jgi:hypothetical protein
VSASPARSGWAALAGVMIAAHAALAQQATGNGAGRTAPPAHAGAPPLERGKGAAAGPAGIDVRQSPGHRTDPRLLKELAPKPFGSHPTSPVRRAPPEPITGPPRNAIGVPLGSTPAQPAIVARPSPPFGVNATGPVPSRSPMGSPAAPPILPVLRPVVPAPTVLVPPRTTGLNGTAITRPGSGPAMIGGGRTTTGINGTSIRPKHGN